MNLEKIYKAKLKKLGPEHPEVIALKKKLKKGKKDNKPLKDHSKKSLKERIQSTLSDKDVDWGDESVIPPVNITGSY